MKTPIPFAEQLAATKTQEVTYSVTELKEHKALLNHFFGVGELFTLQAQEGDISQKTVGIVISNSGSNTSNLLLGEVLKGNPSVVATKLELDLD